MLPDSIRSAIVDAAEQAGVSPAFALAVAERESSFNPRARASKTIRGLFQMTGGLRQQYGIGDSDDPGTQAAGWARFIRDTRKQMAGVLGRDPTDSEAYLGHHFGAKRAARMLKMDPATPVNAVFTPYEMRLNPHFARAGTVGALDSSVMGDIDRRSQRFGGTVAPLDLADFGDPVEGFEPPRTASAEPLDLSSFGDAPDQSGYPSHIQNMAAPSAPPQTASAAPALDLSAFGEPVS